MTRPRPLFALVLTLLMVAAVRPAWAQIEFDDQSFAEHGGAYSSDCRDPASPRVVVSRDSVEFIRGDMRIVANKIKLDGAYFGRIIPESCTGWTLVGDLASGQEFRVVLCADANGPYLTIEENDEVLARVGTTAIEFQYRRCAAPADTASASPGELPGADVMILDPAFKAAYRKALKKYAKEPWLLKLDGPSGGTRRVIVADQEYLLLHSCREADCAASNTTLLYSAGRKLVYGKVSIGGKSAMIGSPPPAVAMALGEYWRTRWVQHP